VKLSHSSHLTKVLDVEVTHPVTGKGLLLQELHSEGAIGVFGLDVHWPVLGTHEPDYLKRLGKHDNQPSVLLPNELPKVFNGTVHWALAHDPGSVQVLSATLQSGGIDIIIGLTFQLDPIAILRYNFLILILPPIDPSDKEGAFKYLSSVLGFLKLHSINDGMFTPHITVSNKFLSFNWSEP
jgi:hypothetical protein